MGGEDPGGARDVPDAGREPDRVESLSGAARCERDDDYMDTSQVCIEKV